MGVTLIKLYGIKPGVGFFTTTDQADRAAEADVALAGAVGLSLGWHYSAPRVVACGACNRVDRKRAFPAVVGREKGVLKDFADITLHEFVASRSIVAELETVFRGFELRHLIVYDPSAPDQGLGGLNLGERYPSLTVDCRKKHRGAPPAEIWLPKKVRIADTPSTFSKMNECAVCGNFFAKIAGVEQMPGEQKVDGEYVMMPHQPRRPGEGLLVPSAMIGEADGFETDTGLAIVRESVKVFIESKKWKNIRFLEVGEII